MNSPEKSSAPPLTDASFTFAPGNPEQTALLATNEYINALSDISQSDPGTEEGQAAIKTSLVTGKMMDTAFARTATDWPQTASDRVGDVARAVEDIFSPAPGETTLDPVLLGVARGTVARITRWATEPAIARSFLDSSFFQSIPPRLANDLRLRLLTHMVRLDTSSPEQSGTDYREMKQLLGAALEGRSVLPAAAEAIGLVAQRNPEEIEELSATHEAVGMEIGLIAANRALGLDDKNRTRGHDVLMEQVNGAASTNIEAYVQLLTLYEDHGTALPTDATDNLLRLIKEAEGHSPEKSDAPIVPATTLIRARNIAIRQLARDEKVDEAIDLTKVEGLLSLPAIVQSLQRLLQVRDHSRSADAAAQVAKATNELKSQVAAGWGTDTPLYDLADQKIADSLHELSTAKP